MTFAILPHLTTLIPDGGSATPPEASYHCPVCNAPNFKVNTQTGEYNAFGCDCMATSRGKQRVIEAISPATWDKPLRPEDRQEFIYDGLNNGAPESIAQVVRIDDGNGKRQFYQQHWDGGKWAKGLPDDIKAQVHLYRIFSNVNEAATGDRIFLVEGEGKADTLLKLGIPATCAIGGAGKWKQYGYPHYLKDLEPYQVVLCPDRDEPGVKHCEEIEADLKTHGIEVAGWLYAFPESYLWQRLPKNSGADVADWIADGAGRDDILNAVEPKRLPPEPASTGDEISHNDDETNCSMRVRYHRIKKQVGDRLRFNQLTKGIELDGQPLDLDDLQVALAVKHNIQAPDSQFQKIVTCIAKDNAYSPVVEYLNQVQVQHGSSTAILSNLSSRYFGTDHPLYDTYIRKTLIAAVARAYQPGCKVDTALILQGRQGALKSSFFKVLATAAWFDDSLGNASDKDERLKLHKVWFVEWAELETVFKRRDVSTVKAFLSSSRDLIRPPYGRTVQEFDRPSIIVGTTNEVEFLADPTGSRRYWVIPVAHRINLSLLQQERDRIWAAAVAAYRAGEPWWLNDADTALSEELNQEYATQDPWANAVEGYVNELISDVVTTEQILDNCIHLDLEKQDKRSQMRIAGIMKQLGWEQQRRRVNGGRLRVWARSVNDEKKSFFGEIGWDGRDSNLEPLKNQGVEGVPTLSQPPIRGRDGRDTNGGECDDSVCHCPDLPLLSQPTSERLGQLDPLQNKGCPDRPDLFGQNSIFSSEALVGATVSKVDKVGWRGEIVRLVGQTHADVQWTSDPHPKLCPLDDLQIVDSTQTASNPLHKGD